MRGSSVDCSLLALRPYAYKGQEEAELVPTQFQVT